MPDLSLHLPRFLRFRRSRSRSSKSSTLHLHDDTGVIRPSDSSACLEQALPSCPLSGPALERTSSISSPSAVRYPMDPQDSAGRLVADRARENITSGQPPQAPQPTTPAAIGSVTQQSTPIAFPSGPIDFVRAPQSLLQPATYTHTTHSQQSPISELPSQSLSLDSSQPQRQSIGMFNQAENFSATGNFVDGNVGYIAYNYTSSNQFMKELLEKTIPGAEFDSSDRDPPPRCHPGTRLAILERCLHFISSCDGPQKIRWVVGAAGVGKSAIMQNVAESPELAVNYHASVFFSINGRNDGTKAVTTLSYQFAAKSEQYRQVIEQEITRDPSLLRSSMAKQFSKLIVEPFIYNPILGSGGRVLVIIDGLDECRDARIQQELLRLISEFCLAHPSSPVVWLLASRPETHITAFFARRDIVPVYEKEEIPVDSDEARADVERFLRDKLAEIRDSSVSFDPQWPEERDFWKLADAAGGLFAYASTAVRYIGDSSVGSPVSQLSEVLAVIDKHLRSDVTREEHPMALLDALYNRILANVPAKIMVNTRKLLLALASGWNIFLEHSVGCRSFIVLCNWLGMTRSEAYAALNHLYSVLHVPRSDQAHEEELEPFHKSFIDYISDFTRSRFSPDAVHEGRQLIAQCTFRVLKEALDGVDFAGVNFAFRDGAVRFGPGTGDNISLTWIADEGVRWDNNQTRIHMYQLAIGEVLDRIKHEDPAFMSELYIHLVTISFCDCISFPYLTVRDFVFNESQRPGFMRKGTLRETTFKVVDISKLSQFIDIKLQFRRHAKTGANFSDPWDATCRHVREGKWKEGDDQDWKTEFRWRDCGCSQRLKLQLRQWKTEFPDHTVSILFTTTPDCCVEFRFVDPKDGVSEWTYWFWCEIPFEERDKYGINV